MKSTTCESVILGRIDDPHVRSVINMLPERGTVVIDVQSLPNVLISWGLNDAVYRDLSGRPVTLDQKSDTRGWIRRLAPAGWDEGAVIGNQETASMLARLGTIGSVARDNHVAWLSLVDQAIATENKMFQYRAALGLGIDVPETVIAADAETARQSVGKDFIVKPVGPGSYNDNEGFPRVVFTQSLQIEDLSEADLLRSPFILQRRLHARSHFRVVTVLDRAWVAKLDAAGLPLDWRSSEVAHGSFVCAHESELARKALSLANRLSLGYSSQDWIRAEQGEFFVDLNPGGQWMFLPEPMSLQVSEAIAVFLRKGDV